MTFTDIIGGFVIMSVLYAFLGWAWAYATLWEVEDRQRALRIAWAAPVWPLGLLCLLGWWIGWRALPGLAAAWREAWGKPQRTAGGFIPPAGPRIIGEFGPELLLRAGVTLGDLTATEPDTIPDEPPPPAGQWQQPPTTNQAKPAVIPLSKPHLKHVPR